MLVLKVLLMIVGGWLLVPVNASTVTNVVDGDVSVAVSVDECDEVDDAICSDEIGGSGSGSVIAKVQCSE